MEYTIQKPIVTMQVINQLNTMSSSLFHRPLAFLVAAAAAAAAAAATAGFLLVVVPFAPAAPDAHSAAAASVAANDGVC